MDGEFTCQLDGHVMRGETDDDLAAHIDRHLAEAHPDLAGKVSGDGLVAELRAKGQET
jgi:hypothetical protein